MMTKSARLRLRKARGARDGEECEAASDEPDLPLPPPLQWTEVSIRYKSGRWLDEDNKGVKIAGPAGRCRRDAD